MAFDINAFRKFGIPLGGARPALFEVLMTPPGVSGDPKQISFQCMAAQLPAWTTGVIEVPYFGRKVKVAGDRVFQDWTVNIINDEDFAVRAMMEKWSNEINTLISNVRLSNNGNIEEYKSTDAIVTQFSKFGENNPIRQYRFVSIFPSVVEAINLDWDRTNTIETFAVTFSYDYFFLPDEGQVNVADQVDAEAINTGGF